MTASPSAFLLWSGTHPIGAVRPTGVGVVVLLCRIRLVLDGLKDLARRPSLQAVLARARVRRLYSSDTS
jgi:hypothetical protein